MVSTTVIGRAPPPPPPLRDTTHPLVPSPSIPSYPWTAAETSSTPSTAPVAWNPFLGQPKIPPMPPPVVPKKAVPKVKGGGTKEAKRAQAEAKRVQAAADAWEEDKRTQAASSEAADDGISRTQDTDGNSSADSMPHTPEVKPPTSVGGSPAVRESPRFPKAHQDVAGEATVGPKSKQEAASTNLARAQAQSLKRDAAEATKAAEAVKAKKAAEAINAVEAKNVAEALKAQMAAEAKTAADAKKAAEEAESTRAKNAEAKPAGKVRQ